MKKLLTLTMFAASLAAAQTPSGLLTGPVSYISNLTSGNPYGDNTVWTVANGTTMPTVPPNATNSSTCSAAGTPSCYIVHYVVGTGYGNLQASDGTSTGFPNCYTWDVSQFILDDNYPLGNGCENSFHGGGSGEYRTALYCGATVSSDMNGYYNLNCQATFGGTSVVDGQATFTVNVNIQHIPVWVWVPAHFRTQAHWEKWQQIDSMSVGVTPQPTS